MAEKNYLSAIALGIISVSFLIMASSEPVHGGRWLVLACFFGCGFFAQILVVNGIMQVTPVNQIPGTTHSHSTSDYRNYHYNSIVAKVQSSGVTVNNVEDAIKTYSSLFNVGEKAARPFFQNQFVMATLGLNIQNAVQLPQNASTRNQKAKGFDPNFWENVSEGVAKNEANSDESCAVPGCSKAVTAFDFRCFKCRSRFCSDCETGKSIMCKACS